MGKEVYRRCSDCGTVNINTDHCDRCGGLVNINLKRKLERQHLAAKKKEEKNLQEPNAVALFFKKALNHPNLFIRILAKLIYSVWVVVMVVGTFIAFLFSYVAA